MHNLLRNDTEGDSRAGILGLEVSHRARASEPVTDSPDSLSTAQRLLSGPATAADELIKYHQSFPLSVPADAHRNVCLRRIARVRLGMIYRGGLSECQKYRIIIPRVRALSLRSRAYVRAGFTTCA